MKNEERGIGPHGQEQGCAGQFFLLHYYCFIILSSSLNRHNFFIFLCQKFFNLRDYIYRVLSVKFWLPHSFASSSGIPSLTAFFMCIYSVTACVAYTYFCGFAFAFTLFGQLLAAFLCQWRNTQTDDFTVVFGSDVRSESMIAFSMIRNILLSHGLMASTACIGSSHGSYITDGNHASIRVNTNAVQQPGTGLFLHECALRPLAKYITAKSSYFLLCACSIACFALIR